MPTTSENKKEIDLLKDKISESDKNILSLINEIKVELARMGGEIKTLSQYIKVQEEKRPCIERGKILFDLKDKVQRQEMRIQKLEDRTAWQVVLRNTLVVSIVGAIVSVFLTRIGF